MSCSTVEDGHCPVIGVSYATNINRSGQRVHDVVAEQIRENRSSKRKLTSKFWDGVIKDFGLKLTLITDNLPAPDPNETVSHAVFEKLGSAHCDNPAQRTTDPLERFLDSCEVLTYTELFGIISASMEGPKVLRAASTRMFLATLRYIVRPYHLCATRCKCNLDTLICYRCGFVCT